MTRRKLFGRVALSGLALSSVGTLAASTSLAAAAGLTRLSLNENPLGPSPLAVEAIQNALTEIARYAGDDAHARFKSMDARDQRDRQQFHEAKIFDAVQAPVFTG